MPNPETIYRWQDEDSEFSKMLTSAREKGAEPMADECVRLTDDCGLTHEEVGRTRLRIQSRMWLAGKLNRRFADKPGDVNIRTAVQVVVSQERQAELQERKKKAELETIEGKLLEEPSGE